MSQFRNLFVFLALCLCFSFPSFALEPVPSLSRAEVAAAEMVADYLARGPMAFSEKLSSDSPWVEHDPKALREQIVMRAGPFEEAIWELQTPDRSLDVNSVVFSVSFPSGIEDLLVLDLSEEGGEFRLKSIRSLADPDPVEDESSTAREPAPSPVAEPSTLDIVREHSKTVGIVLGSFLFVFAFVLRKHQKVAVSSAVAGLLVFAGSIVVGTALTKPAHAVEEGGASETAGPGVSPAEIRKNIALGKPFDLAAIDVEDQRVNVWVAQHHVQAGQFAEAKAILDTFPHPAPIPLVDLLRARVAVNESDEAGAGLAYSRVLDRAPFSEHLWTEAADTCLMFGFEDRGGEYIHHLMEVGSRSGSPYYRAASLAVVDHRKEEAEEYLRRAIRLEPVPRETLITAGFYWEFLREGQIAELAQLYQPEEPVLFPMPRMDATPLRVGSDWKSYRAGDLLLMRNGKRKLIVPGGADYAPSGVETVDALALQRLEEDELLAESDRLMEVAESRNSWKQPVLRRRLELLCRALGEQDRWQELIRLTENLPIDSAQRTVDPQIYRVIALKQMKREEDSRSLAAQVALAELKRSKPSAANLYQLGEVLAMFGEYETAIRLLERASTISDTAVLDDRIRQLAMNQTLSSDYRRTVSDHFDLRYPDDTSKRLVSKLVEILEAERERLAPRFPGVELPTMTVHILRYHDFRTVYTHSNQILGFFDGTINLPFAEVSYLTPPIVAILTHELTHAFVSEATRGKAPTWLQEGYAQRLEMVPASANAFNRFDRQGLLSLSVLDSTIRSSPDPGMLSAAYVVSATFVRFLEERYGKDVMERLMAEYAGGTNDDAIFRTVCGKGMLELDREFREWGWEKERVFVNPDPIVYDRDPATEVQLQRGRPKNPYDRYGRRRRN